MKAEMKKFDEIALTVDREEAYLLRDILRIKREAIERNIEVLAKIDISGVEEMILNDQKEIVKLKEMEELLKRAMNWRNL